MTVVVATADGGGAPQASPLVAFTVFGDPAPAGSKRAFRNRASGRIQVTDASKRSKPWQAEVRAAALDAYCKAPLNVALSVAFVFYRPRPSGHYGSGRNAATVRASAPAHPATRPDVLKLARAVEDALTGIIWRDDAQIVSEQLEERYGSPPRCEVRVWPAEAPA